jgi:hypothetical protein
MAEAEAVVAVDHLEEANGNLTLGQRIDLQVEDLLVVAQADEVVMYKVVVATLEIQEKVEQQQRNLAVAAAEAEVEILTLLQAAAEVAVPLLEK